MIAAGTNVTFDREGDIARVVDPVARLAIVAEECRENAIGEMDFRIGFSTQMLISSLKRDFQDDM